MGSRRNFYDVLNVSAHAQPEVIRAAYRALIRKYHPDAAGLDTPGTSAAEITEAFNKLKDPESRAAYDRAQIASIAKARVGKAQVQARRRKTRVWLWSGWFVSFGLGAYVALLVGSRLLEPAPPGRDSPRFEIGKSEVSARPVAPGRIAASSDRRISTMEVDWPDLEIANQMPIVNTVHTTNGNIEYLSGAAAQAGSDGQADDVVYGPGAGDATER